MSANQVEEVKSKTDIVSIIGEYVDLKKAGRNYKANCPFHGEKTPSFMVSPELQIFKCFGCARSGDVFTFLEEQEGMSFGEVLKYLAEKAAIKLESNFDNKSEDKEIIFKINQEALKFYKYVLKSHPQGKKAYSYLINDRKLEKETVDQFGIGYSPFTPGVLPDYLMNKKKFKLKDLDIAGLVSQGRGKVYDRFGGRVIFPLKDHRGQIVGFAGRLLPWDKRETGKYINSPDTPVYHKSKVLYGLDMVKADIRVAKYVVMVEGELDMISSWQAGIKNVVAIKGSALTEDQIRLLSRFTNKIVMCLDADFAGDEAARRGAILASNLGMEVKIATLIGYKDPDEAAKQDVNALKKAILNASDIWDFLINLVVNKHGLTGSGKSKISREIVPMLSVIGDKIVQAHYVEMVSRKLSVPFDVVMNQITNNAKEDKSVQNLKENVVEDKSRRQLLEERLLTLILLFNRSLLKEAEVKTLFGDVYIKRLVGEVLKINAYESLPIGELFSRLPAEMSKGFQQNLLKEYEKEELEIVKRQLTILVLRETLNDLSAKIGQAEEKDNQEELRSFQISFSENTKKLSALESS